MTDRLGGVLGGLDCSGPASEAQITRAELELGVQFPVSYRSFLKRYGSCLGKSPYELAGIPRELKSGETPLYTNVVHLTSAARKASRGNFPAQYVMISNNGQDESYCIDTGVTNPRGESPVVAVGPRRVEVVATSFEEFALKVLTEGAV